MTDGVGTAKVIDVDVYGNFVAEFQPSDMNGLYIKKGKKFFVSSKNGKESSIFFGSDFSDVEEGDWVAFESADGNLKISQNRGDAAKFLGISVGDSVSISLKSTLKK